MSILVAPLTFALPPLEERYSDLSSSYEDSPES